MEYKDRTFDILSEGEVGDDERPKEARASTKEARASTKEAMAPSEWNISNLQNLEQQV